MVDHTATASDTRIPHRRSEARLIEVDAADLGFPIAAGRPCLDLVATIGERWRRGFERLRTPSDLGRWIVEAGLLATPPARVTRTDLDAARQLRASVARAAMAWGSGEALGSDDVAAINAAASAPDLAPSLAIDGAAAPRSGTVRAVLSTVARDTLDLLVDGDPDRLRECAAADCSLLFYDASRPGVRRWCSMQACGNRHKASRYRNRRADRR